MQGDLKKVVDILLVGEDIVELALGIVDERAKLLNLILAHGSAENLRHLPLDVSGGILEYMAESLALAMYVSHEMLCPFREVEYSLKIDYLGAGGAHCLEILGKELQHALVAHHFCRSKIRVVGIHAIRSVRFIRKYS